MLTVEQTELIRQRALRPDIIDQQYAAITKAELTALCDMAMQAVAPPAALSAERAEAFGCDNEAHHGAVCTRWCGRSICPTSNSAERVALENAVAGYERAYGDDIDYNCKNQEKVALFRHAFLRGWRAKEESK